MYYSPGGGGGGGGDGGEHGEFWLSVLSTEEWLKIFTVFVAMLVTNIVKAANMRVAFTFIIF